MITDGVKTTLVLAMQLLCHQQPMTKLIPMIATVLFNRLDSKIEKTWLLSHCTPRHCSRNYSYLHIYTDGSFLDFSQGAGASVFSDSFSFYLHDGTFTTHFDGVLEAYHVALQELAVRLDTSEIAVIFSDSISALHRLCPATRKVSVNIVARYS
ncbi:hypothetical protein NPIL_26071 [Nephila pilipes]|uniref:RNase H type-1 domain-containing protein n=1 Tax=Nephila pilipes TaxID=299642 RepID=A0A8X6TWA2_NEPPI|nr:hypothetical protein NPIL_26071 [Nephila pilipes]